MRRAAEALWLGWRGFSVALAWVASAGASTALDCGRCTHPKLKSRGTGPHCGNNDMQDSKLLICDSTGGFISNVWAGAQYDSRAAIVSRTIDYRTTF